MFGLSEGEMETYQEVVQNFAVTEVTPKICETAIMVLQAYKFGDIVAPALADVVSMKRDIESVVTLTSIHMSYEYAHLQCEMEMDEADVIKQLHTKYETYVINQFIKYGLGFTVDTIGHVVGEIMLELPYLYVQAIEDDNFDDDLFLEEKLEAYNNYLDKYFSKKDEDKDGI